MATRPSWIRLGLLAAILVGCTGVPLPGAIDGPVMVQGVLLDRAGEPVPQAEVTLSVSDLAGGQLGRGASTIYELRTTTDGAGRFVFRGRPSPELIAFVDGRGIVTFDVTGFVPATGESAFAAVHQGIDGSMWTGEPGIVELRLPGLAP